MLQASWLGSLAGLHYRYWDISFYSCDRLIAAHLTSALIAQAQLHRVRFAKLQAAHQDAAPPQRSNAYRHSLAAVFNREALAEIEGLARSSADRRIWSGHRSSLIFREIAALIVGTVNQEAAHP